MPLTFPSSGTFKDVPLFTIFRSLKRGRRSGILTVQSSEIEKSVHFDQGEIVWATSNYSNDRISEVCIRAGKINLKQYDITTELFEATRKKKGVILVEEGFIQPKELFDLLLLQVQEIVLSLFDWKNASYTFYDTTHPAEDAIGICIDPHNIMREAIYRMTDWTQLIKTLPALDSILERDSEGQATEGSLRSAEEKEVLALINSERSVRDILMLSSKRAFIWAKILNLLIATGIATFRLAPWRHKETGEAAKKTVKTASAADAQRPQDTVKSAHVPYEDSPAEAPEQQAQKIMERFKQIASYNYYEMLGVSHDATAEAVKSAYTKLAKTYHPDRYTDPLFSGLMKQIEHIFIEVRNAYDTLSVETKRKAYDAALYQQSKEYPAKGSAQQIKTLLDRGEEALQRHDLKMAIYFYEEALRQMADRPEKAAIYLRYGQMLGTVPGQLHAATEAFQKSAALDLSQVKPYLELGAIFSRAGLTPKAIHAYQAALKRDPKNKSAQAEITRLTKKEPRSKG